MDDLTKRLNKTLGGIKVPEFMHGDNLAIGLCTLYENADEEPGENGWTESAERGCDAVLQAIRDHYAPLAGRIEADAARIRELERDLKSVLDRESATTARYDNRIGELEALVSEAREKGYKEGVEAAAAMYDRAEHDGETWDYFGAAYDAMLSLTFSEDARALLARMGERDDRS